MSEHNLILEFYKPTYNLDFDYDGDGGLDLHFTSIKGEFFMTMENSYDGIYFDDVDCQFYKGEMFASVDLGDLVERIINGEFRQTDGKAISDWAKRFLGDGEEQIEFNGKNYADGSLFWDDFFKEMPKDEIKDFMTFCEDYLYLPNIEVDTVSNKWDFENGKVELKSNDKWGIGISDDYNIILVDEFTCDSVDAFVAYDVASSESDEDDFYESKKSARKSLKEEKVTDSLFGDVVFSMIKKFKLKKEYDVERPSWTVFNFRHKNKDAQFAITFDERGHGDFLYGDVLAFGDEKDDIFKYKTDEVKIDSYNIEKECSNIIADCLAFIDTNKKITIFESKKSIKRSLKERDDTIFSKDVKRWMLSGNDINITFKDGNELVGAIYEHRKDSEDKKAECFLCEDLTADYTGDYFIVEVYNGKISEIKFQSYDWLEHYMDDSYNLMEAKKSTRKSLKEKLNDNGDVRFNDIYLCDLVNVLTVTVYDKELYEKLREEDLVLYQKGVYEQIDWKSFQDEIGYLRDDIYASDDFDVKFTLSNGVLIIDVLDNTDKDVIMEYRLESKIVN